MSNLGAAPGYEYFSVPNHEGVKFDVFPGAQRSSMETSSPSRETTWSTT